MRRKRPYGEEMRKIIDAWQATDHAGKEELVKQLQVQYPDLTYQRLKTWVSLGIEEKPEDPPAEEPEDKEPIIIPAPLINIKPIRQEVRRGQGEEVHVQPINDPHAGLRTPTYNKYVLQERMDLLFESMVKLCLLHRKMRPIRKLVVPLLGDMAQGEQYGVQGHVEEFEMGAEEQIYEILLPIFSNFFINALQVYEEIEIDGIPGNHGNIQRRSQTMSKRSNWDTVFYRALQLTLAKYSRITINIPEPAGKWYLIRNINGWNFLMVHGDQIVSYQGIPFYGIERRSTRWKQSIGVEEPFDYMLTAHVHNPNFLWNNGVPTYINGCLITDSPFPLVRMGLKDVAQVWSLFVNRKYGVTASYRIQLDPISAQAIAEKLDITEEKLTLLYKLIGQFKKNLQQKRVAALC